MTNEKRLIYFIDRESVRIEEGLLLGYENNEENVKTLAWVKRDAGNFNEVITVESQYVFDTEDLALKEFFKKRLEGKLRRLKTNPSCMYQK